MKPRELPSCIVLADNHIIIPMHPNARKARPVTFECEEHEPVTIFVSSDVPASAFENADVLARLNARRVTKKIRLS